MKKLNASPIFNWNGKDYDYSGIFNLIKSLDYDKVNNTNYKVFKAKDLLINVDAVVIAFQDSKGKNDYLDDFNFFPKKAKAYKGWSKKLVYCNGFYKQYQDVRDSVVSQVKSLNPKEIIIIGWSLGGGISPICAEDMYFNFNIKPIIISFESPNPCANSHTRDVIYDSIDLDRSVSFLNGDDIVPHLPWKPFAYRLTDLDFWIKFNKSGSLVKNPHFNIFKYILNPVNFHTMVDESIDKYFTIS